MEKIFPRTRVRWKVHRIERKRGEEIASANDSEAEDIHTSDNDTENNIEKTESNTLDRHVSL